MDSSYPLCTSEGTERQEPVLLDDAYLRIFAPLRCGNGGCGSPGTRNEFESCGVCFAKRWMQDPYIYEYLCER